MYIERSLLSSDPRKSFSSNRRSFPIAARISALLIVILLAISSTSALISLASAHDSDISFENPPSSSDQTITRLLPSWNDIHWDWAQLADDEGFVDVIISFSDEEFTGDPLDRAISELNRASSETSYSNSIESLQLKAESRFSIAFPGFAAHMRTDHLQMLLEADPAINAYPDLPVYVTLTDSVYEIGADQLWARSDPYGRDVTGIDIVVAVLDTGVDYTHPDLGGGIGSEYKIIGGYDFYNDDSDPMDDHGHGTHVAGIIAADGNDTKGVAPDAKLLAYKVLGADGAGSMSDVITAIERALDPNDDGDTSDHADVISMSLGGPGEEDDPVCLAVKSAVEAGVVVVIAAGNEGPSMGTVASPGLAPEAITVGAVDSDGVLASFSSRATTPDLSIKPEISAPGVEIMSTIPYSGTTLSSPTGYMSLSGTSMATPHVSGGAALLLQLHPDWSPEQVKSALITGARSLNESLWAAGAGEIWLPSSADMDLFVSQPLISYGLAGEPELVFSISNSGSSLSLTVSSNDWYSLSADGMTQAPDWVNVSTVNPSSLGISAGGSNSLTITITTPDLSDPEGYYEGAIYLVDGSHDLRIPFGYAVLSRLNIHVLDTQGREVFDIYGGVWVYDIPDANVAMGIRGNIEPAPPASFLLPSGDYAVHAAGHQLLYTYSDPYLLSDTLSIGRLETKDVNLQMSAARQMTLALETDDGKPIYVKDYRVYCRHVGERNVSFHLGGSDYSITGSELFSLPKSKTIFVSDTEATVGISIAGFSYTSAMWDFMSRNWEHWYEYASGTSTEFYIEASTDLQYLLAWEFDGIDGSVPLLLTQSDELSSVYETKYDIPGKLVNVWGDWGTHRSIGGDATFYIRRDTDTSLNSFFSGMTRTTIVQGTFSELYFPGDLFEGYSERQFYTPDYDHLLRAGTASEVYLPDRNFLTSIEGEPEPERLGSGPFYPALHTSNTNDTLVLFQPLLRGQAGAKVGGMSMPSMNLYRNGAFVGIYQLSEYLARPDARRIVTLNGPGSYSAMIEYSPSPQICSDVTIELGFVVPSDDVNPPLITNLQMSQRFVPGDLVALNLSAADDLSPVSVEISWRAGSIDTWKSLLVNNLGSGLFATSIQTSADDTVIDLKIRVSDSQGNYLEYIASNAALEQIPVSFDISVISEEIGYRDADESVVLTGHLTDILGNPLNALGAVPLELMLNDEKIGMILDEYIVPGSHAHNGSIRFDWHFNPINLFNGPDETVEIHITFDLGIYEPVSRTISLRSIESVNDPPVISLISPSNSSLIAAGEIIDLNIIDDGAYVVTESYLNGEYYMPLSNPWDIDTTEWLDGAHQLDIIATDDELATSRAMFEFEVDASPPLVEIVFPENDSCVPMDSILIANVSDEHLSSVYYSVDEGASQLMSTPYLLDMTGWLAGNHTVVITAYDLVGYSASDSVSFEIVSGTLVVNLDSPSNGAVIRSGLPIIFSVLGVGTISCTWSDGNAPHVITPPYVISTVGWADGVHQIVINATSDLGGWDELNVILTIDDTNPTILLEYPVNGSFVGPSDQIFIRILDVNFDSVCWTIWGQTIYSGYSDAIVYLTSPPADGYFYVEVTAVDQAGNQARALFIFGMDSSPPSVSINNFESGDAIMPEDLISITAEDRFLSLVQWSLDEDDLQTIIDPYEIDSSDFPVGWHELHLKASDASGKSRFVNVSLYVDGTLPTISAEFPEIFMPNTSLELIANISDDYAIEEAFLFYELLDGSFASVEMSFEDAGFIAVLEPEVLWDNMTFFVIATDEAGNVAEGGHQTLTAYVSSSDEEEQNPTPGPLIPDDETDEETEEDNEDENAASWWSGILGNGFPFILVAFVSAAVLIALLLSHRETPREIIRGPGVARGPVLKTKEIISREGLFSESQSSSVGESRRYRSQATPMNRSTDYVPHRATITGSMSAIGVVGEPFKKSLQLTMHSPDDFTIDRKPDTKAGDFISRESLSIDLDHKTSSSNDNVIRNDDLYSGSEPRIVLGRDMKKRMINR